LPAKLVVTATPKGSRIALLGSSGKQLLSSAVFTEPRAKGATLRALRGILGDVTVEDNTTVASLRKTDADAVAAPVAPVPPTRKRRAATKTSGTKRVSRRAVASNGATKVRAAASPAKRTARRVPKR
jgi:hypothetical protein